MTIAGLATARGYAAGPVFIYRGGGEIPIPEYVIGHGQESSELLRLHRAIADVKRDLEGLISVLKERSGTRRSATSTASASMRRRPSSGRSKARGRSSGA